MAKPYRIETEHGLQEVTEAEWREHRRAINRASYARTQARKHAEALGFEGPPRRTRSKAATEEERRAHREEKQQAAYLRRKSDPNKLALLRERQREAARRYALNPTHFVVINCQGCGKEKKVSRSDVRRGKGRFCSRRCANLGRPRVKPKPYKHKHHKGEWVPCEACGDLYYRSPSEKDIKKFCSRACYNTRRKGKSKPPVSLTTRQKISENHVDVAGEKNPNWKGGITQEFHKFKNKHWKEFAAWRDAVLVRDHFTCRLCGSRDQIEAHHIVSLRESFIPAFLVMNGVALCRPCHTKTDSYGVKAGRIPRPQFSVAHGRYAIYVIPHAFQAYETVGNYETTPEGITYIFVSDCQNSDYHILIAVHEMVESFLCRQAGITDAQITQFDLQFEQERAAGVHQAEDEPGNDVRAPYYRYHQSATRVEQALAAELNLDWDLYDQAIQQVLSGSPRIPPK